MTTRTAAPPTIASRILTIRGQRVMLDADLADLYSVPTIMRAFVQLREMATANTELSLKLDELERRLSGHDEAIAARLTG
jgi:hypothetical protein